MSDPVKSKSAFLAMYMANHPDTLATYVMHELYLHDKPYEGVRGAKLDSIDSQSMKLSYHTASKQTTSIIIPFDPPLRGYEEVRPRLTAMKQDAEEHLGMAKHPKLDVFRLPRFSHMLFMGPVIGLLFFVTLPGNGHPVAEWVRHFSFGWKGVTFGWAVFIIWHAIAAVYTSVLCKRVQMSESNTTLWIASSAFWGTISISRLRGLIAEARLRSVHKKK